MEMVNILKLILPVDVLQQSLELETGMKIDLCGKNKKGNVLKLDLANDDGILMCDISSEARNEVPRNIDNTYTFDPSSLKKIDKTETYHGPLLDKRKQGDKSRREKRKPKKRKLEEVTLDDQVTANQSKLNPTVIGDDVSDCEAGERDVVSKVLDDSEEKDDHVTDQMNTPEEQKPSDDDHDLDCISQDIEKEFVEIVSNKEDFQSFAESPGFEKVLSKATSFVCPCCNRSYSLLKTLRRHVLSSHSNEENFRKVLNDIEVLQEANTNKEIQGSIQCSLCKENRTAKTILNHIKRHHEDHQDVEKAIETAKQDIGVWKKTRRSQRNAVDSQIDQTCQFCGKTYKKTCIRNHIKFQCRENPERIPMLHCPRCGYKTVHEEALKRHFQEKHGGENTQYKCDLCDWVGMSKSGFFCHYQKVHQTENRGDKCKCLQCGKSFRDAHQLRQHSTVHSDQRIEVCSVCEKVFKTAEQLSRHIRTVHLNQYPYHCEQCGHGVAKKDALKKHKCSSVRRQQVQVALPSDIDQLSEQGNSSAKILGLKDSFEVYQSGAEGENGPVKKIKKTCKRLSLQTVLKLASHMRLQAEENEQEEKGNKEFVDNMEHENAQIFTEPPLQKNTDKIVVYSDSLIELPTQSTVNDIVNAEVKQTFLSVEGNQRQYYNSERLVSLPYIQEEDIFIPVQGDVDIGNQVVELQRLGGSSNSERQELFDQNQAMVYIQENLVHQAESTEQRTVYLDEHVSASFSNVVTEGTIGWPTTPNLPRFVPVSNIYRPDVYSKEEDFVAGQSIVVSEEVVPNSSEHLKH